MEKTQSCGFLDVRADSFRELGGETDDFPYYSKRIRAALRCDIEYLYQKNVGSFCVSENNDSDITFMSLVADMRDDMKNDDIGSLVYCSLDQDDFLTFMGKLAPYSGLFMSMNSDAPQKAMLQNIDYLIYIDGNNRRRMVPYEYRKLLKGNSVIHYFDGLLLNFKIDYSAQWGCLSDLPLIIKTKDLSLMKIYLESEIECRKDRIHSAKINTILKAKPDEFPEKFIEDQKHRIDKLSQEAEAVHFMLSNNNSRLKRLYWKWQRKSIQGINDSSDLRTAFFDAFFEK